MSYEKTIKSQIKLKDEITKRIWAGWHPSLFLVCPRVNENLPPPFPDYKIKRASLIREKAHCVQNAKEMIMFFSCRSVLKQLKNLVSLLFSFLLHGTSLFKKKMSCWMQTLLSRAFFLYLHFHHWKACKRSVYPKIVRRICQRLAQVSNQYSWKT